MKTSIFRNYDIRGIYPTEIDEGAAYKIGYFFGEKCSGQKIILGHDTRLAVSNIFKALSLGIADAGGQVVSLGLVPTSMIYYADIIMKPGASIMITASHNSKEYIGFKMMLKGESFCGEDIACLGDYVLDSKLAYQTRNLPEIEKIDLVDEYLDRIFKGIKIDPSLKIGWDLSNGAACGIFKKFLSYMPNNNIIFNDRADGSFPAHPPDPTNHKNLAQFTEDLASNNCDLGIAFDGDADRVVFVTSKGDILEGDQILAIFAGDILKKKPGSTIISEVKCSNILSKFIESASGKSVMSKTGHSNIKLSIAKHNAILAGELSCHFFFVDDYYGYDDALYASLRMVDILSRNNKSLVKYYDSLPKFLSSPEIKIDVAEEKKFELISSIQQYLHEMGRDFIDIDGARYSNEDGWWLIRASNTNPQLSIRFESYTKDGVQKIESDLNNILSKFNLDLQNHSQFSL